MGRVVQVTTERLGGGAPARELFAVAVENDQEAIEKVSGYIGAAPDEKMEVVGPLSETVIDALRLKQGGVRSL